MQARQSPVFVWQRAFGVGGDEHDWMVGCNALLQPHVA